MELIHIAQAASSEARADDFYQTLLGLEKVRNKTVPADVCRALFGLDRDIAAVDYQGQGIHFEIFIAEEGLYEPTLDHVCLKVDHPDDLLDRAGAAGLEALRVPKGEKTVKFIRNLDGCFFEIV